MFNIRMPFSEDPRPLSPGDMHSARIGEKFWSCSFESIPKKAPHKAEIGEFIDNIIENVLLGKNMVLHGKHGSGKSVCGTLILKNIICRRGSGLMMAAEEIHDVLKRREIIAPDTGETYRERMIDVDVLLIDDLNFKHLREWERASVEMLVRSRSNHKRTTIITTNHNRGYFKAGFKGGVASLGKLCRFILVDDRGAFHSEEDGDKA